jgi:hypothetical protein
MENEMFCKIQPSTETDLPHILELNKVAIPAVNLLNEAEIWSLFSQAEYFHSLWLNQEVIGFLIALGPGAIYNSPNYHWFELRYDQFLYIDRIVIDPIHQGLGYGQMLYDRLREFASDRFQRITCEVNLRPRNEASLRFHQRYGFQEVGIQDTEAGEKTVSMLEYKLF